MYILYAFWFLCGILDAKNSSNDIIGEFSSRVRHADHVTRAKLIDDMIFNATKSCHAYGSITSCIGQNVTEAVQVFEIFILKKCPQAFKLIQIKLIYS